MIHTFRLYRSGYSGDLPWDDNQLWASGQLSFSPEQPCTVDLRPEFGSAASWYRVEMHPIASPETLWVSVNATLNIDAQFMGTLPLAWYTGSPSDWPSGLARFPESHPPQVVGKPDSWKDSRNRGVWSLAAFRSA